MKTKAKKKTKNTSTKLLTGIPHRVKYPEYEKKHSWLPILLDSYTISDVGTKNDLAKRAKQKNASVACGKGCQNCCLSPNIPISKIEIYGISWYVIDMMDAAQVQQLLPRLDNHQKTTECPFLLNSVCSIYDVRPLACREYFVFNTACGQDEDVWRTRPDDMFIRDVKVARQVAMRFLDFEEYGLKTKRQKEEAFEAGIMGDETQQMHKIEWSVFANQIRKARNL